MGEGGAGVRGLDLQSDDRAGFVFFRIAEIRERKDVRGELRLPLLHQFTGEAAGQCDLEIKVRGREQTIKGVLNLFVDRVSSLARAEFRHLRLGSPGQTRLGLHFVIGTSIAMIALTSSAAIALRVGEIGAFWRLAKAFADQQFAGLQEFLVGILPQRVFGLRTMKQRRAKDRFARGQLLRGFAVVLPRIGPELVVIDGLLREMR